MECVNTFCSVTARWRVFMFLYAVHMLQALFGFEGILLTKTKLLQKLFTPGKLQEKNEMGWVCGAYG